MDNQVVADSFFGANAFFDAASHNNLGVVLLGGFCGGLLQPVLAKLNPKASDPPTGSYWQSPLLGIAAAGITVYVIAHTDPTKIVPLLFFSLLCGLAFPALLSSAVDNVGKQTAKVQEQVAAIAADAKSDGITETAKAAKDLRAILQQNPPDTMKPEGQPVIEAAAQQVVTNIAQTPADTPVIQRQVVEELKDVGTVAQTAGWQETAQTAAYQLQKLSETIDDKTTKAAAQQAADRLNDAIGSS